MRPPDVVHWKLSHQLMYMFEIDRAAIEPLVPPSMEAIEIRPGISLFGIECLHYEPGHFGPKDPVFDELVLAVPVQPNLGVKMPVPKYCIHGASVWSNSTAFIEDECRPLFANSVLAPKLRFDFTPDGTGCDVLDGEELIVSCRNTNPAPVFEAKVMWGQFYTDVGGFAQGIWRWQGELSEHMKRGEGGTFREHPFFRGLDLSRIRGCYRQMAARANTTSTLSRWLPGVVPDPERM